VDAVLAQRAPRWPSLTAARLAAAIDRIVARVDRDAVRRARESVKDRHLEVYQLGDGSAAVCGSVFASTGQALDRRLEQLAATVCEGDGRTPAQRRADAIEALVCGAAAMVCGCGRPDCAAAARRGAGPVLVHVVAEQASLTGAGAAPGYLLGEGITMPAAMLAELAPAARLRPLTHPGDEPAEPGYTPSRGLADYVRCRDLTCRAPGCDRPASDCDLDHTIAYAAGGQTHASNLKCLCRTHHLLKTFWGWRDQQLPDATVIWTLPSGQSYVTTPGSALLFPTLAAPTAALPTPQPRPEEGCGQRAVMMPKRQRSRAQNRAHYNATERAHNRNQRLARDTALAQAAARAAPPTDPDEPPPF
jgi:hypothetical protein